MRWFWIDRFIEFQSGHQAVAIKNVSMAEEHLAQSSPAVPMMPGTLIIEGLAQTGGILVSQQSDFQQRVVLAKVAQATFHRPAVPGDTLIYTATIQARQFGGALIKGTSHIGETLQAEIDLFFAELDERFDGIELFEPLELVQWLRCLQLFEVGRNPDGTPIHVPDHMIQAERSLQSNC